jgi:hypothetical protein
VNLVIVDIARMDNTPIVMALPPAINLLQASLVPTWPVLNVAQLVQQQPVLLLLAPSRQTALLHQASRFLKLLTIMHPIMWLTLPPRM